VRVVVMVVNEEATELRCHMWELLP
jgi:hypothetical protein